MSNKIKNGGKYKYNYNLAIQHLMENSALIFPKWHNSIGNFPITNPCKSVIFSLL